MKQSGEERIASIALIVFSLPYLGCAAFPDSRPSLKQQLGPEAFPKAIGLGLLLLSSIYAFQQFRGVKKTKEKEQEVETRAAIIGAEGKIEGKADLRTMGFMLAVMLLYAFVFEHLGYAISAFLAFMAGILYLDRRHIVRDAIIAVIASFFLQYVFTVWLRVQLPAGPLRALGGRRPRWSSRRPTGTSRRPREDCDRYDSSSVSGPMDHTGPAARQRLPRAAGLWR